MLFKKNIYLKNTFVPVGILSLLVIIAATGVFLPTAAAEQNNPSLSQAEKAMQFATKGAAFYAKGKYDKALEQYNKAIALDSENASFYRQRGWVYEAKKQNELARADYEKELGLNENKPRRDREYYFAANYYDYSGSPNLTIISAEKIITIDNKNLDGYYYRGIGYLKQKQYDSAIANFNTYINLARVKDNSTYYSSSTQSGEVYALRSRACRGVQQYDLALDGLNKIALPPLETYIERGNIYYDMGQYDKALAEYNEAMALEGLFDYQWLRGFEKYHQFDIHKNYKFYLDRGHMYLNLKKYDLALEDCNYIINLPLPEWGGPWFGKVREDYHQNETMLQNSLAYSLRAKIYREKGDVTLAIAEENRAKMLRKQIEQYYLENPGLKKYLRNWQGEEVEI